MEVIEALRTSIPEPHDHPDINHDLMFVGPGATSCRLPVTGFLPRSEDGDHQSCPHWLRTGMSRRPGGSGASPASRPDPWPC